MENTDNLKTNYNKLLFSLTQVHTIFENKDGNIDDKEFSIY